MMPNMPKIPAPFCAYRPAGQSLEEAALVYANRLEQAIQEQGPETVLAFIMEPVGGAATGALTAPDIYYRRVREICDRYGLVLIFDEVMSGAGRTGKFLAAEHFGVMPDIAVLAKGLAAGYMPLGAIMAPARMVDAVEAAGGFAHGHTYSASPLACAVGRAVLAEMRERDLMANALSMGDLLRARLQALADEFPFIGEVRGRGLLLGFDIVADRATGRPLPPERNFHLAIQRAAMARGLMIYTRRLMGGLRGDNFLISPPLILGADDVAEIALLLRQSLSEVAPEIGKASRTG
jgi:adenosylmethionine-8-amino-7-oxononanoate aminotransferase